MKGGVNANSIVGVDFGHGKDKTVVSYGHFDNEGRFYVTPKPLPYQPRDQQELEGLIDLLAVGRFRM